jgi:beta-galactosidase
MKFFHFMLGMSGLVAALAFGLAPAIAGGETGRITLPLADGWRFKLDGSLTGAQAADFPDNDWSSVSVPHSWNRVGYYMTSDIPHINRAETNNPTQGIGWYRLHITPGAELAGKKIWLQFDAASRVAEVWANGQRLGAHAGGFSRFRFDATDALKPGQTAVIAVKVDNSVPAPGNATADTIPLAGDFFVHGGLYRAAAMIATAPIHIDMMDSGGPGIYGVTKKITSNLASVSVRSRLVNDSANPEDIMVLTSLLAADGKVAATQQTKAHLDAGANGLALADLNVNKPHLWQGVDDPYLYRLIVDIQTQDGKLLDHVEQNYGLRDIHIDPDKGLFLNGRHLGLHGVSRHQDREGKGWALSAADEEEDVNLIREMGANTIRLAHYQQSEHMNDLADKYGLILWDEIPLVSKWTLGAGAMEPSAGLEANIRQQLTELIRQNFNHASVAVWSIANEVDFGSPVGVDFSRTEGEGPDPTKLLKALHALSKQEDPDRPSTLATCCEGRAELSGAKPPIVADITDVFGANRYFGWYYAKPQLAGPYMDKNHAEHPTKPLSVSEYGAGGAISQQTDNPRGGPASSRGRIQPEDYESYVHEVSWADFSTRPYIWASWIWNMFDFATTIRREGDAMDINTKGLVTYDRAIKKDVFYFYQANWSKKPVTRIAGHRYIDRAYGVVDVKVYSNAPATDLIVNGRKLDHQSKCLVNTCTWPNIHLNAGVNKIQAIGRFEKSTSNDEVFWTVNPAAFDHIHIDSGALMGRVASTGRYGSDTYFEGGDARSVSGADAFGLKFEPKTVTGTPDNDVLGTYRAGTFTYKIPVKPGRYIVTLRFAEPEGGEKGKRIFEVIANRKTMVQDLDVFVEAGGSLKALERKFEVDVKDTNLILDFKPSKGEAIVSAIEIDRQS